MKLFYMQLAAAFISHPDIPILILSNSDMLIFSKHWDMLQHTGKFSISCSRLAFLPKKWKSERYQETYQ